MHVQPRSSSIKGSSDMFTGDVWYDVLVRGEQPSRLRVNLVRFTPGARSAWHAHALGQTLHVIEGLGRAQVRGQAIVELHPGDTVQTPPGEWHWHGAAPDHFMSHLAVWEAPADDQASEHEWGDHVTDEEYRGR